MAALERSAVLSRDGHYRYALRRVWDERGRTVLFVALNPSTADHRVDDPTIRRCIAFARAWGFGQLTVANVFAFRTPSPRVLLAATDPVGPRNDEWIRRLAREADVTIAAWGNHGAYMRRDDAVLALLDTPQCLAVTQRGQPKHPLYILGSTRARPLPPRAPTVSP